MNGPRNLLRLLQIYRVLTRHGLEQIATQTHLLGPARFLFMLLPAHWLRKHEDPVGVRLRKALEDLGPIFVKFGQALSTRPDLFPSAIVTELARLQDAVPPFPGAQARAMLEETYKRPVAEVFADFDETPLASASIAQVHCARLIDGQAAVVKVLRPGVEKIIQRDLAVLKVIARLAHRYWEESRRLRPKDIVAEYEKTVMNELDLMREAANAAQLRRNWPPGSLLYVPEIYWDYCKTGVMAMEQVGGIPVSDIAALRARNVDFQALAERGVEIFFTQVFEHNFFHADMHPGNIFVDVTDPAAPRYVAVDFGIVGTLTPRDQHYLAANLLAFFKRDYRRIAELHVESGWVPSATRVDEFESAIRTVCEPIFNRPLKEISFGHFLLRLFQTARQFNMEVQPQLVLLQKTLLNIEGLGRQLYPDLDLWKTAQPFLERWTADQVSGREMLARVRDQLPELGESLQELPMLLLGAVQKVATGRVSLGMDDEVVAVLVAAQREQARARHTAIAGAAVLLGGVLLLGLGFSPAWLGWLGAAGGAGLLVASRPPRG